MAEAMLKAMLKQRGLAGDYRVDSAGTQVTVTGRKPDARTLNVLGERGIGAKGIKSRGINTGDFLQCDYILAMDGDILTELEQRLPPESATRLVKIMDYASTDTGLDVPDPYFGNEAGFEVVANMLEKALQGFVDGVLQPNRQGISR